MKINKLIIGIFCLICISINIKAQVKVGGNPASINADAMLEIEATNKGLLLPRVNLDSTGLSTPLANHVQGMLVYNQATSKDVTPGYYYNDGSKWIRIANNMEMANNWNLTGNKSTNPNTNFLGTTDNNDLIIKRNSIESGWLNDSLRNTTWGVGTMSLINEPTGKNNTAIGHSTLNSNVMGDDNIAIGYRTLNSNLAGSRNIAIGNNSLFNNLGNNDNIAIGNNALFNNTTNDNIAIGNNSLYNTTVGYANIALGNNALYNNTSSFNNVAIGVQALESIVIGSYNTALGGYAGQNITGMYNTALGFNSGNSSIGQGNYNITIGANTEVPVVDASYQLNIGNWIYGTDGFIGIGTQSTTAQLNIFSADGRPVLKLQTPYIGNITDSILTWNYADSTVQMIPSSSLLSNAWLTTGNKGTNSTTNFIGTTDSASLLLK